MDTWYLIKMQKQLSKEMLVFLIDDAITIKYLYLKK